jgi:hypothetical protein
MGGWCSKRQQCPNYAKADRSIQEPAERLCHRGSDGVGQLCELAQRDAARVWPIVNADDRVTA